MLAVKKWLDNVPSDRLRNKEQRCCPQHHRPTGVDGRSYGYWKEGRDEPSDEGYIAHETGEESPHHSIGHTNDREADRNNDTKAGVEHGLHQEETAQSRACVVQRGGAALKILGTRQPKKS